MKHKIFLIMLAILLFSLLQFFTGASYNNSTAVDTTANKSEDQKTVTGPIGADLIFVGDAMQHQGQLDQALSEGGGTKYDYTGCFDLVAPIIAKADYAVCNLEVPLGGGPRYSGYPCFSAPDSYAEALRDAGFDMMLTANNHCLDSGDDAARRTLTALDRLGIAHTGTYSTSAQRDSLVPLIKEINGIRCGFLNYTYGTNGISPRKGMEVAFIEPEKIISEMKRTRSAGAEILIVTIHWGIEYVLTENQAQRSIASLLIDNGADLIIGSHPHVIQPMKVVRNDKESKDVLVVYSLGNFISNMKTTDTRGGAMVKVRLERDSLGKAYFKNASYDTFFSAKPHGKGTNYRVYPSAKAHMIPEAQQQHWQMFNNSARRIFDKYNVEVPPFTAE